MRAYQQNGFMVLKIGFTGSRKGMTSEQKNVFAQIVDFNAPFQLHHGDCIGADEFAHKWYYLFEADTPQGDPRPKIVVHPPENDKLRAFCGGVPELVEIREEKDYHSRNRDIVDETEWLMAFPRDRDGEAGSGKRSGGTWWTVRYARSVGKTVIVVSANGEQSWLNG